MDGIIIIEEVYLTRSYILGLSKYYLLPEKLTGEGQCKLQIKLIYSISNLYSKMDLC